MLIALTGCYSTNWNTLGAGGEMRPAPRTVRAIFEQYPGHVIAEAALAPGYDYQFDIGEKDAAYGKTSGEFIFTQTEMRLHDLMPPGKVIVDFTFRDEIGTVLNVPNVDLMRLIPQMDARGDMRYPEIILEELNRFGLSFRREHGEFTLHGETRNAALERAYRVSITNNCLDPGKWEMALVSADFTDFEARLAGNININQNRMIAHSWFPMPKALYQELLNMKNPTNSYDVN
ncbi:MAG: hypothetical protein AAF570_08270, partial [Bacteroidota bacterium]